MQQIRENVIVSLVPTTDIDGRDRYVDWYNAYKINEGYDGGETYGEPPYRGSTCSTTTTATSTTASIRCAPI